MRGKRPILYIFLVALILRLAAINHGFPNIYHPDEPAVIRSALGIRFDPNPRHFDWPHLYFYVNYLVFMIFAKLRDLVTSVGLKTSVETVAPVIWNDNLIFYLLSRILSAVVGGFTVVPLYLWTKKLVGRNAGLFAAALLALAPFHVRQSHYALIDVPMLFFLCWALYFTTISPILSGLFLGFSMSTKYNGLLGGVFILLYYLLQRTKPIGRRIVDIIKVGLFTVIGFLIGTPFALLDNKTFLRTDGPQGALWQFTNVGKVVGFLGQIRHFFEAAFTKLPNDLGYGAVIVFSLGLTILVWNIVTGRNWRKVVGLSALTFLVLTFYVSGLEKIPSHYYMVTYPFFFLVSGYFTYYVAEKIKSQTHKIGLVVVLLAPSLFLSILNINDLINKKSNLIYGGDTEENAKINP